MRRKHFVSIAFVAIVCSIGYATFNSSSDNSDTLSMNLSSIIALSGSESGNGNEYRWSNDIDCPGWWTGDYRVCQQNGYGNTCNDPGATTCTCEVNCN